MNNSELILKIHRIENEKGEWMPAIEDVKSHDIDPMWVAGVAFLLIDRYVNAIEESEQNNFYEKVMDWFNKMTKGGSAIGYVEKIDLPESME